MFGHERLISMHSGTVGIVACRAAIKSWQCFISAGEPVTEMMKGLVALLLFGGRVETIVEIHDR